MTCEKCHGTGVDNTGNNLLPCDCPAGDTAKFDIAGVRGMVTGAEMKRHFLNNSSEPIKLPKGGMNAEDLPGRKKKKG